MLLAIDPGESIRQVAQHLHTPYETVRQAVNRLEAAGYLACDDGLFVTEDAVRSNVNSAREKLLAEEDRDPTGGKA